MDAAKPLVIVGTGLLAEQIHFYFETLGGRRVDGATARPHSRQCRPIQSTGST